MHLHLDAQGGLTIAAKTVTLKRAWPVVNGQELDGAAGAILAAGEDRSEDRCVVKWTPAVLEGGVFYLEAWRDGEHIWLQYRLEALPAGFVLAAFGLRFQAVEGMRQYLCSGYYSWDSSLYVQPEGLQDFGPDETRPETGYAMTQILPQDGQGSLVIGFDRHDRFQQTFTFDTRRQPPSLTILTLWDQKDLAGPADASSDGRACGERLAIFEHAQVEEGLREWARLVAKAAPVPPRLGAAPITGWCSWYNLYASIDEQNIREHLAHAVEASRRVDLPMRVFQIDDGFTPEMGDWLAVKPQFPHGMKAVLDEIRAAGFIPGLWIAPFMVGNRSDLYREHPDWVVQDQQTGGPLIEMAFYGEFRWHKRSEEYYILDATHPQAFAYLRNVFRTWRQDWGCEYFKTDFMHFGAAHGPERALWHTAGRSRIEIWRRVAEMIRQEIGDALWLGCGCPLWAGVGLVDGVRIGRDVGVAWDGALPAQLLLSNLANRSIANHILWQADPDCVLLRQRYHYLAEHELCSLALFAGMLGGVTLTSDDLGALSPERLRLWKLILPTRPAAGRFPLLGQNEITYERWPAELNSHRMRHTACLVDPMLVQTRVMEEGRAAVLFFNSGDEAVQRSYSLERLGLSGYPYGYDWSAGMAMDGVPDELEVGLEAHASRLIFLFKAPGAPIHL